MPTSEDLFAWFALAAVLALAYHGTRWMHRQKPAGFRDRPGERGQRSPRDPQLDERASGFVIGTARKLTRVNPTIDLSLANFGPGLSTLSYSGWRPMVVWMNPETGQRFRKGARQMLRRLLS